MKLKTAIYIIDSIYGFFIISGLLGIVVCIVTLKEVALVIGILTVITLFFAARFIKVRLINLYLKKCKYPFEFLSVLEQLSLTKDLQINSEFDKSQLETEQFVADNKLTLDIGKSASNYHQPIISFKEKGLFLDSEQYDWTNITEWGFIDSDTSAGRMEITYHKNNPPKKLIIDLNRNYVNRIDLMLLLAHFKAKYG